MLVALGLTIKYCHIIMILIIMTIHVNHFRKFLLVVILLKGFFRSICFERKTCGVSIIEACSVQKYRELQPFLIHHPILSFALIKEPLLQISNDSILYITFFMPNVVNNYLCENNVSGKTLYLH